jgi:hypothetical protein
MGSIFKNLMLSRTLLGLGAGFADEINQVMAIQTSNKDPEPPAPPLTRQQRRAMERKTAKKGGAK